MLSPLLFVFVMAAVSEAGSEAVRREIPWEKLYADDLIVAENAAGNFK